MKNRGFTLIELLVVLFILTVLTVGACAFVNGPSDEESVHRTLEVNGFTQGQILEKNLIFNGCDEGEIGYDVSAYNSRGVRVDLTVCVPQLSFKGSTIRTR